MFINPSENLHIAGAKGDQYSIVVYDTNGNVQWTKSVKIYNVGVIGEIIMDNQGNTYIGGCVWATARSLDFLLIKNLQLFPDQQIRGFNALLFTIGIGIFLFVIILKFKPFENEKKS